VHIHSVAFLGKSLTAETASGQSTPSQTPNGTYLAVIDSTLYDAQCVVIVTPTVGMTYNFDRAQEGSPSKRPRIEAGSSTVSTRSAGKRAAAGDA
jgi:hypothetical protein